jgi:ADP-heptose:LPS heptosyltransferase
LKQKTKRPDELIRKRARRFKRKRAVERLFFGFARVGSFAFRRRHEGDPERILVLERILRIGDSFVNRPALEALREKYPDADITVLSDELTAPLRLADPWFDEVLIMPSTTAGVNDYVRRIREGRFGVAYVMGTDRLTSALPWRAGVPERIGYDYAGRGFSLTRRIGVPPRVNEPGFVYGPNVPPIHIAQVWLNLVEPGAEPPTEYPLFDPGEEAREEARKFLAGLGLDEPWSFVVFHPFGADANYGWVPENWRELAALVRHGTGKAVVYTGSLVDRRATAELTAETKDVNAAGRLSVLATVALAGRAAAAVSVDTAMVHIASTIKTPVVALYGPGDPVLWGPLGVPHRTLIHREPCSICKRNKCFQPERYCMESVTVEEVLQNLKEVLYL